MQILDLPSIPKEKKALQAIINDARHKVFIQRWLRRGIIVLVIINAWAFGCQEEPPSPTPTYGEEAATELHALFMPFIRR